MLVPLRPTASPEAQSPIRASQTARLPGDRFVVQRLFNYLWPAVGTLEASRSG